MSAPKRPSTPLNAVPQSGPGLPEMRGLVARVGAHHLGTIGSTNAKDVWMGLFRSQIVDQALEIRDDGIEALHKAIVVNRPLEMGVVEGNIGLIAYFPSTESKYYRDYIAEKHTALSPPILKLRTAGYRVVGASRRAKPWVFGDNKSVALASPIAFEATNANASQDSEYLLLNLYAEWASVDVSLQAGHVFLFTERLPCPSCEDVIQRFVKKYPNLELQLGFLTETERDSTEKRQSTVANMLKKNGGHQLVKFVPKDGLGREPSALADFEWKVIASIPEVPPAGTRA